MDVDAIMRGLPSFCYQQAVWSLGDRLFVNLDFGADVDARREALLGLGLTELVGRGLVEERLRAIGGDLWAQLFGNDLTLVVGPEDAYEHLGEDDLEHARRIQSVISTRGLEPWVSRRARLDESPFVPFLPARSPRRRSDPLVVTLELDVGGDWRARVRGHHAARVLPLDDEVELREHLGGHAIALDDLQVDDLALARVGVGLLTNGQVGAVISQLERIQPDRARVEAAELQRATLVRAGVEVPWPDARRMARDLLLRAATGDPAASPEQAADRLLREALHAFPIATEGSPVWAVRWGVWLLDRLRAPCLFAAADLLRSAGDVPKPDALDLLDRVVRDVDRGLAAHDCPQRVRRATLGSALEQPLLVAITDAELEVLVEAGRLALAAD